ncbi:MAG: hypothetical protein LBU04_05705 [Christensenellaceae bacterium]|jgi:hypothetical protein|nr:hypothetical protein [Christensenellaceae bacterium]
MNKHTLDVLIVMNEASKDGEAAIIESDEFLTAVPGLTQVELDDIVKELSLTECIRLRYHNGKDYCVIALPKGRLIVENDIRSKTNTPSLASFDPNQITIKTDYKKIGRHAFIGGFLGAFIASAIGIAIDIVLKFVL